MSFGSRRGGFDVAKRLKTTIAQDVGWHPSAIYLDADALAGKAGTVSTDLVDEDSVPRTANLNPNWSVYYRHAINEAPAMVFVLSQAWCESKWCSDELIWYLCQRTGADLQNKTPDQLTEEIFSSSQESLAALRAGAFFVRWQNKCLVLSPRPATATRTTPAKHAAHTPRRLSPALGPC